MEEKVEPGQLSFNDYVEGENGISILVKSVERIYYARGIELNCYRCGRPIIAGSWYKRKKVTGRGISKTRYYHLSCWRELWLDL